MQLDHFACAVPLLTGLEGLTLRMMEPASVVLAGANFSGLKTFTTNFELNGALSTFINNHTTIASLRLERKSSFVPISSGIVPLDLPILQVYSGDANYTPYLRSITSLRRSEIFWIGTVPIDSVVQVLASSRLNTLDLLRSGWNVDLLDQVAEFMPDLYSLSVVNVLIMRPVPTQVRLYFSAFLDAFKIWLCRKLLIISGTCYQNLYR